MLRIAMLSKWHVHAAGYAEAVRASGRAEIACVWDEDADRGRQWAQELGVGFEASLDTLLARSDVDAVIVCAPTSEHCPVMTAAARAGKHIFTEKTMAPTLDECREITAAVEKNGIKFCISHPFLTTGVAQYVRKAIDDGLLGRVHYMRMRDAHDGSLANWLPEYWYDMDKAAGGAMMDLGCHPMYTAAYLLGRPRRVASVFNTTICPPPAEDNAVSVVEFENNAIAVLETSFITPHPLDCLEVLGTEGAILCENEVLRIRSSKFGVEGWVKPDKLPNELPSALNMWLDGILTGKDISFNTGRGEALAELLENAYRSHREQRIVPFGKQDSAQQ